MSTFEVTLPRGPHSAFTGFGELCKPTKNDHEDRDGQEDGRQKGRRHAVTVKKKVTVTVSEALKLPTVLTVRTRM